MDLRNMERVEWKKQRAFMEEVLGYVPDGRRLFFHKEFLERLLFEEIKSVDDVVYYCGKRVDLNQFMVTVPFKVPVWSGEFLRKLDLSEVSFQDVLWDSRCHIDFNSNMDRGICYSDTNALIDLFQAKKMVDGQVRLFGVNFSGTPLIDLRSVDRMDECSFGICVFPVSETDLVYDKVMRKKLS